MKNTWIQARQQTHQGPLRLHLVVNAEGAFLFFDDNTPLVVKEGRLDISVSSDGVVNTILVEHVT